MSETQVFVLEPKKDGYAHTVHGLADMQAIVGGDVEQVRLPDNPHLFCFMHENAALQSSAKHEPNFHWKQSVDPNRHMMVSGPILGPVFFSRVDDEGELAPLSVDDIQVIKQFTENRA